MIISLYGNIYSTIYLIINSLSFCIYCFSPHLITAHVISNKTIIEKICLFLDPLKHNQINLGN